MVQKDNTSSTGIVLIFFIVFNESTKIALCINSMLNAGDFGKVKDSRPKRRTYSTFDAIREMAKIECLTKFT